MRLRPKIVLTAILILAALVPVAHALIIGNFTAPPPPTLSLETEPTGSLTTEPTGSLNQWQ